MFLQILYIPFSINNAFTNVQLPMPLALTHPVADALFSLEHGNHDFLELMCVVQKWKLFCFASAIVFTDIFNDHVNAHKSISILLHSQSNLVAVSVNVVVAVFRFRLAVG